MCIVCIHNVQVHAPETRCHAYMYRGSSLFYNWAFSPIGVAEWRIHFPPAKGLSIDQLMKQVLAVPPFSTCERHSAQVSMQ